MISKILQDDEMGVTDDGTPIDVKMDALGVLGRLNSGQCIEQELNWLSNTCRDNISKMTNLNE